MTQNFFSTFSLVIFLRFLQNVLDTFLCEFLTQITPSHTNMTGYDFSAGHRRLHLQTHTHTQAAHYTLHPPALFSCFYQTS